MSQTISNVTLTNTLTSVRLVVFGRLVCAEKKTRCVRGRAASAASDSAASESDAEH